VSEHIDPATKPDDCRQYIPGFNGEMFEVTSLNRPDTSWRFVDVRGHEHRWFESEKPATGYNPMHRYSLPTLVQIIDVESSEEYPGRSHYECRECRALDGEPV